MSTQLQQDLTGKVALITALQVVSVVISLRLMQKQALRLVLPISILKQHSKRLMPLKQVAGVLLRLRWM